MDPTPLPPGWVDNQTFEENQSRVSLEVLLAHAGRFVAWSMDGSRILASAETRADLSKEVRRLGLSSAEVVHSYNPAPGETFI